VFGKETTLRAAGSGVDPPNQSKVKRSLDRLGQLD
jgi:hypothetical protein